MDMIREQRATIEGLRGDLKAALREKGQWVNTWDETYKRYEHQAELCQRLTALCCSRDLAMEAAEIVGKEAVEAILKTLPADDASKCYD